MAKKKRHFIKCECSMTPKLRQDDDNKWFVQCPYCGVYTDSSVSKDKAADIWNEVRQAQLTK